MKCPLPHTILRTRLSPWTSGHFPWALRFLTETALLVRGLWILCFLMLNILKRTACCSSRSLAGIGGGVRSADFMVWFLAVFPWFGLVGALKDRTSLKS